MEREIREGGWGSWDEVRVVAAVREKWKDSMKALCAMGRTGNIRRYNLYWTDKISVDIQHNVG